MARIDLQAVSVEFPIYNIHSRSFKKSFIRLATGGSVVQNATQHIVVKALNNINLTLKHGDHVGLIGHNGAGKTTLLRLLANIYEPVEGNINIQGRISPMLESMEGIEAEFTGYENIEIRGKLMGLTSQEIRERRDEIIELTGLGDFLKMPVRTYSTGMMIRLAFAISTSIQPDILVIDEILGTADASFMKRAEKKIDSLLEQSSIVVIASHSDEQIRKLCNKGLLLDNGQIKFFGPLEEAFEIYHAQEQGVVQP